VYLSLALAAVADPVNIICKTLAYAQTEQSGFFCFPENSGEKLVVIFTSFFHLFLFRSASPCFSFYSVVQTVLK